MNYEAIKMVAEKMAKYDVPWTPGYDLSVKDMCAVLYGPKDAIDEATVQNLKTHLGDKYEATQKEIEEGMIEAFSKAPQGKKGQNTNH